MLAVCRSSLSESIQGGDKFISLPLPPPQCRPARHKQSVFSEGNVLLLESPPVCTRQGRPNQILDLPLHTRWGPPPNPTLDPLGSPWIHPWALTADICRNKTLSNW